MNLSDDGVCGETGHSKTVWLWGIGRIYPKVTVSVFLLGLKSENLVKELGWHLVQWRHSRYTGESLVA